MTKEQEEAIECLRKFLKTCDEECDIDLDAEISLKCNGFTTSAIETILSMLEEKDKQINLMIEKFADIDFDEMCLDCGCCIGNGCVREDRDLYKDCIKQYFENKVRQESDKGATGK